MASLGVMDYGSLGRGSELVMCASCGCGCKHGIAAKGCTCKCKDCREARSSVEKSFIISKAFRDLEEFEKGYRLNAARKIAMQPARAFSETTHGRAAIDATRSFASRDSSKKVLRPVANTLENLKRTYNSAGRNISRKLGRD